MLGERDILIWKPNRLRIEILEEVIKFREIMTWYVCCVARKESNFEVFRPHLRSSNETWPLPERNPGNVPVSHCKSRARGNSSHSAWGPVIAAHT